MVPERPGRCEHRRELHHSQGRVSRTVQRLLPHGEHVSDGSMHVNSSLSANAMVMNRGGVAGRGRFISQVQGALKGSDRPIPGRVAL
jgi:hypothetical protein